MATTSQGSETHADTTPLVALLHDIVALYRDAAVTGHTGSALLQSAVAELEHLPEAVAAAQPARTLPVRRYLSQALANAGGGSMVALARALARAEARLDWLQNPNYTAARMGPSFVANYGYIELVGPGRTFPSDSVLVGFLLLGPETLYPDHQHAAEEVYHIVSGAAFWRRGRELWQTSPAGSCVHHSPYVPHAVRTAREPLLALYCWMGKIAIPADLAGRRREGG